MHPVDIPVQSREWLEAAASNMSADDSSDPALTPRAWWRANAERTVMEGLERSLEFLKEILKNNTFDVRVDMYVPMPNLRLFIDSFAREYWDLARAPQWQAF